MQLTNTIEQFKKDKSDGWVAKRMNAYLPQEDHVTRQAVWQWQQKDSADPGVFYALIYHAPIGSAESVLAYNALLSLGRIHGQPLEVVEVEESTVS